ncbi:cyclic nucleotide-binding domain-containing protein [Nocardioides guangzhouensis]|uniref:Cyclic nucleotide-binding domain-containing protein n=1 Tax=Nocardioides guangzhouensis TaxID=2497878 RepID=A0A4Q4ZH27_9ACTN|nr:cyclic nucleotide-binding domain-containing protein [Nocardioides guangzhouensis]RYP87522.1 cyclic nucleotide-binding domain-containing protein [Nocardioides guangzhouensis]
MFQRHGVPRERIDVLRQVPFFDGLSNKHLARIDQHLDEVNVEPGRVLTEQGEGAYEAFIIADGVAEIRKDGKVLRDTDIGELIGEIGILKHSLRSATVVAKTPMRLLVLNANEMSALLREDKKVAERVQENLDRHLEGR